MAKKTDDGTVQAEAGIAKASPSRSKYPWATMRVGESFKTPGKEPAHGMAYNAKQAHSPKTYSAGKDASGQCRIWRDK